MQIHLHQKQTKNTKTPNQVLTQNTPASYQFPGKDVLVEVVLDLLIGNVDTQLFKGVALEVLKAKYVQQACHQVVIPAQSIATNNERLSQTFTPDPNEMEKRN